ncbi:TPA: hypothetical protein ACH3X1_004164 [Trebouxia sp. C0004]
MKTLSLQAGAVNVQWQLKSNMCAQFINIDPEDVELASLVPRATTRVIRVAPRPEDADFSKRLAGVVLRHVEGLVVEMSQVLPGAQLPFLKARVDMTAGRWSPDLKAWLRTLLDPTHCFPHTPTVYFKLLRDCNAAILLTQDHGFELGLQFLGRKCSAACEQMHNCAVAAAQGEVNEPKDVVVTALLWDLSVSACDLTRVNIVLKAVQSSLYVGFPKFKALVKVLQDMVSSKDTFHGIVFVRQRQGVHAVAALLQNVPELGRAVAFHTFTGHPAKTKVQLAQDGADAETVGMPTRKQQEALQRFRDASGREILVATAAAQEGLDIVNCSFVVCYSVTECGVQLMQWRGRTRMFDSQIFMLMESGSSDETFFGKACMEATNNCLAQVQIAISL